LNNFISAQNNYTVFLKKHKNGVDLFNGKILVTTVYKADDRDRAPDLQLQTLHSRRTSMLHLVKVTIVSLFIYLFIYCLFVLLARPPSWCHRRAHVLLMLLNFFSNVVPLIRQLVEGSQRGLLR